MSLKCKSVVGGGWQTCDPVFGILFGPVCNSITDLWEWQGANLNSESDIQDEIEKKLLEVLPHGSGIDCKWNFEWLKNGKVKASNSYHCMDADGYYDGYADFSLIILPVKHSEFKLVFHGREGQNKSRKYLLRDYLEDTLAIALQPLSKEVQDAIDPDKTNV